MHNIHQQSTRPDDLDTAMTDLLDTLIDHGLTRGLLALSYTHGVSIHAETARKYDVAAVALLRALDTLPTHVTVGEVLAGLHRRAITLAESDQREVM